MEPQPIPAPAARALSRWAGLAYLLIILCGLSGELAIRGPLIAPDDAKATATAILTAEPLFRLGLLLDLAMLLSDAALAVLLYLLFRPVHAGLALTAMVFRLVQTAVLAANLMNLQVALTLMKLGDVHAALALAHLNAHAAGYDLGLAFFAVTCIILGLLVRRSGWFPAGLGWLLTAAGAIYATGAAIRFGSPELLSLVQPLYAICLIAELAFCLWLLLRGPRVRQ
ncbi:hypothetical protein RGUI_0743 [Rhodovulum sp. P5]|uniref:DUF4386 domain-containing protein n=1 Tax=Rhodovulum sp. P5 TaxID=1564506 RepID=UPI0009C35915|nr:DUF4386 domain-containing protein [Rhodovulum sp. P5]ARE38884.1 hypothetical protein RGUI_0743 [Rhodovulum sp. P5]